MKKLLILLCFVVSALPLKAQNVWTLRYQPDTYLFPSAAGGLPGFYLVCTNTNTDPEFPYQTDYLKSVDGMTWTSVRLPYAAALTRSGNTLLALGRAGVFVFPSAGGFTTALEIPSYYTRPTGIVEGAGGWVAAFSDGRIYRASQPAGPWIRQLSPAPRLDGIAFGNGRFVAAVGDNNVIISTDGINWSLSPSSQAGGMLGFAWGNFFNYRYQSSSGEGAWRLFEATTPAEVGAPFAVGPGAVVRDDSD